MHIEERYSDKNNVKKEETMQGITAEGYGWDFIWQNMQAYLNGKWLWIYILLFIELILIKKSKKWLTYGLYPYIIFALTVCNPLVIEVAGKILGLSDRYYRFFWLVPIAPMVGFCYASLAGKIGKHWINAVVWAIALMSVFILGKPAYSNSAPPYVKRLNEYYTWNEVIDIAELLHSEGKTNPKVLYSGWLVYDLRQYDPSIISIIGRNEMEAYNSLDEEKDQVQLLRDWSPQAILTWVQLASNKELIDVEYFRQGVVAAQLDYIIVREDDQRILQFYQDYGCSILGEADGYYVLDTEID